MGFIKNIITNWSHTAFICFPIIQINFHGIPDFVNFSLPELCLLILSKILLV